MRLVFSALTVGLFLAQLSSVATADVSDVSLNFSSPVPGTLPDANGLGTGFTDRLPLTGTDYGTGNDPNLNLLSNPGQLTMTSGAANTGGDVPQPLDFGTMETLGVSVDNTGSPSFTVSASFHDIGVETSQLQLYVGTDGNNFFRAGFHDDNTTDTSLFIYGVVNGLQIPYYTNTGPLGIHPGDDASLTLTRGDNGLWSVVWQSLTNPSIFGTSNFVAVPNPDFSSAATLYTGIYYNTPVPRTPQTETSGITSFSVTAAPEPGSVVMLVLGCIALAIHRRWLSP